MSRRLVLIRHAQTEHSHPRGDHERRLAATGVADARALGSWLAKDAGGPPDLVLVSTAVRARQTLEHLLDGAAAEGVEVWPDRRLYDGGIDGVLEAVGEVPDGVGTLWVVGHEPTISSTARELLPGDVGAELARGIPTATAVVLDLDEGGTPTAGEARLVVVRTARAAGE